MSQHKSQVAFEFIALIGFMFLVFVIFFGIITSRISEHYEYQYEDYLKQAGKILNNEVELAMAAMGGYERNFIMPLTLEGNDYRIYFINTTTGGAYTPFMYLNYTNISDYDEVVTVPNNVYVNPAEGVKTGENNIKKEEGIIKINY